MSLVTFIITYPLPSARLTARQAGPLGLSIIGVLIYLLIYIGFIALFLLLTALSALDSIAL
jgi:hypothetical protein